MKALLAVRCTRRSWLILAALALVALAAGPGAAAAPGVAIFSSPGFPYFAAPGLTGPDLQAWFAALGLPADLIDEEALADPARFNADRYAALICLYGNTFPEVAGDNLRAFHQRGGSLISPGVPFCHPCLRSGAAGWNWVGNDADERHLTPAAAHSGALGVKIVKHSPGWSGLQQTARIPAGPGETFTLGGWARTLATSADLSPDALLLRFWDRGGAFLGQEGPALPPPGGDWTFVSKPVTTPPGTVAVDVILVLWKSPAAVCLDDVSLTRGARPDPGAQNLLPNPGFERRGGDWEDLGHVSWFGHDKLGTGGFYTPVGGRGELIYHAENDPLSLAALDWPRLQRQYREGVLGISQALDPASLPPTDKVVPVVEFRDAVGTWPLIALIRHGCPEFKGATDVWAGVALFCGGGVDALFAQREVFGRAALLALKERGAVPDAAALMRRADAAYLTTLPPRDLTPRPASLDSPDVFPKSPRPARKLAVVDAAFVPQDEKLAFASLQGVINATLPRLYVINDRYGIEGGQPCVEERWLQWLKARGDVDEIERIADPWSLIGRWRDEVKGAVITDPDLPATVNIATMLCGLEGAVMLSPRLAKEHPLPVIADLRGRWHTNVDAYRWAIEKLWPRLNHHFFGLMWPDWVRPRDYLIAHKAFCFWITGSADAQPGVASPLEETALMARLLGEAPVNAGFVGAPWAGEGVGIQEGPGVTLLSEYGKFLAWSAETGNLSVHSGTPPPQFRRPMNPPPPLDRTKVYLSFMVSDGDAPINWYSFFLTRYWDDPQRGRFPLAWSLGPTAYDLMPDVMDYYYRKAGTNDTFVCACSGVGYCYPGPYASRYDHPERVFAGFLDLTRRYMSRLDERGVWTHSADAERLSRYAAALPGLQYLLPDYGRAPDTTADNAASLVLGPTGMSGLPAGGVPSFRAIATFDAKGDSARALELLVSDIRQYTPKRRPAFLNAFVQCYPCSPTLLRQVLDQLGPQYVPVLPEHLAALYREAGGG